VGKFILNIPEDIHDKLRHLRIDTKKDMGQLIIDAIKHKLKNSANK